MHLVYIKVQSLMPKVQSQSQKSEALFKLVWPSVRCRASIMTAPSIGGKVKHKKIRFERLNIT